MTMILWVAKQYLGQYGVNKPCVQPLEVAYSLIMMRMSSHIFFLLALFDFLVMVDCSNHVVLKFSSYDLRQGS